MSGDRPPSARVYLLSSLPEPSEPATRIRIVGRVAALDRQATLALLCDDGHGLWVDYSASIGDQVKSYIPALKDLIEVIGLFVPTSNQPNASLANPPRVKGSNPVQHLHATVLLQALLIKHVETLDLNQWKRMVATLR